MHIRKIILLGGLCGGALLGGATQAQEITDWSGFYAGVFAGYALDSAIATSTISAPVTVEDDPGEFTTIGGSEYSERFEAPFGGGTAGYNHQMDRLVLGVEGTLALGGFSKARGSEFTVNEVEGPAYSNNAFEARTVFSMDWLSTFSGKIGMDIEGWLAYGKAGVAVADLSSRSSSSYTLDTNTGEGPLGPMDNGTYLANSDSNQVRAGFVVGAGVEKMIAENVSLGLEYTYVHLGNAEVPTAGLFGALAGGGGTGTFSANMHAVSAKLNHHF